MSHVSLKPFMEADVNKDSWSLSTSVVRHCIAQIDQRWRTGLRGPSFDGSTG